MLRTLAMLGTSDEGVALIPLLSENPELELALILDADLDGARLRLAVLDPELAAASQQCLTHDTERFASLPGLAAVIDARSGEGGEALDAVLARGIPVLTPATARLLYARGASDPARREELLQALHEIVESVDLTLDSGELFARVLEVAVAVTGAEGGSLMLVEPDASSDDQSLRVVCALGMEREIQAKVRVAFGEGVAGRVAAEARPRIVRGRAAHSPRSSDASTPRSSPERRSASSCAEAPRATRPYVR
jgi:hypothetical protein